MKTRLIGWPLLLGMVTWLYCPQALWGTGACTAARFHDWNDNGCNHNYTGAAGLSAQCPTCPPCCGMPRWRVSEPYENLWLSDTPLSYQTSSGQNMDFTFYYRQRYKLPDPDEVPDYYTEPRSAGPEDAFYDNNARTYGLTNAAWGNNWLMDVVFWDSGWEAYWAQYHSAPNYPVFSKNYEALMFRPEGEIEYFYTNSTGGSSLQDPQSLAKFEPSSSLGYAVVGAQSADTNGIYWGDPQTNGFRLVYPDGSQDVFGFAFFTFGSLTIGDTTAHAFLTERIDPAGRITKVGYEFVLYTNYFGVQISSGFRVKYVVDPDGRTNTFVYTSNETNLWQVSEIIDPYGQNLSIGYNPNGQLSSLTDAAQMTSYINYQTIENTNTWVSSLVTPYGTNQFGYYDVPDSSVTDGFQERALYVSQPEGAEQLYCYIHNNSLLPSTDQSPSVPGQTFDNGTAGSNHPGLNYRDTYHWGPRQFADLSSASSITINNFASAIGGFTLQDFNKADMKHWLWQPDGISLSELFSSERDPSPDPAGQTPGLRTWYDYFWESPSEPEELENISGGQVGFPPFPQAECVAKQLPDGSSQYVTYHYYQSGPAGDLVSDNESTYSLPNGSVGLLTTSFGYAANGIDLTNIQNSAGQSLGLSYNSQHQITNIVNGIGQVTTLNWMDSSYNHGNVYYYNLLNITWPSGENASLSYNFTDRYRTNGGIVYGPNYGRLQTVSWSPSGRSFTINAWTNGLPYSVSDDRGLTVTNTWDGLNRLTSTTFPDSTSVSKIYDRLDLGAIKDRMGNWTYYTHDGLQHLTGITNANQAVTVLDWCGCGSLESILDATGTNLTTLNYDNQGNLTNVNFPDYTSLNYQYDLAGRMTNVFDGAGRFLQLGYNNQDLVTSVTGAYGTLQSVIYDAVNRPISVTDANGVTVTNNYDAINELLSRTWLADNISEGFGYSTNGLVAYTNRDQQATYFLRDGAERILAVTNANQEVVQFSYDSLNNVTNLIDGLQHTTAWQYNLYGWLTNKMDGLNRNAFQFGYNANGWVTNRWTPQMGNTGYGYDNVGNLKSITYPQSSISYLYDADNRLTNMVDALGTTVFGYTAVGQLASENGPWPNDTVSYLYGQMLRTNLTLAQASGSWVQGYGYDSAWRLQTLNSSAGNFGYTFNGGMSSLVAGISLPNGANIVNSYDSLARLKETDLKNQSGQILDGYTYTMDTLGLWTNIVRNFGLMNSSVAVGYDNIGQLTSWIGKEASGALRLNEQLGFGFDAADNLRYRTNNALIQTFTVDPANELTNVGRTGTLTVSGNTPYPTSALTVNGQPAQTNADFTFASAGWQLNNGNNTFTNVARNVYGILVTNTLTVNLPVSDTLQYDQNGSLTNDGTRSFGYDTENELTNVLVLGQWRSDFVYDGLGRRRIARDYTWQGGAWVKTNEVHYIYDGYLPIQERDTNNNVLVTYTRGLDSSGSLQKAGGIGGLLARTDSNGSTFYHGDGAGNVTALMDANQYMVARYMYNPFGKLIGKWGSLADANTMQFSSMSQHAGLSLYPFRAYDANLQRWLNQDPIQEWGGINLYRAMKNNPVDWVDPYGLWLGQGVFDSVGDWELNTFNSAWNSVGNFLNDTFFKTTVQTDPNMYYGGTGTVTPITDANGNDITSDLIAEAGLMPLMALGGPEGEGEKLLAGKIACKVKPNDIKKVLALERETSSYLGVIDKSGNINLFKFGENGVLSHQDLVEQGLANQGDLGFSVGLDANGNIVVANMSGLNMPLGLGGQLPPGLYNSVKGAFGAQ